MFIYIPVGGRKQPSNSGSGNRNTTLKFTCTHAALELLVTLRDGEVVARVQVPYELKAVLDSHPHSVLSNLGGNRQKEQAKSQGKQAAFRRSGELRRYDAVAKTHI